MRCLTPGCRSGWTAPASAGKRSNRSTLTPTGVVSFLISGACTDTDVMRGEETQAVGAFQLPEVAEFSAGSLVILPGTHSKHLTIAGGQIQDFRTSMTGELFDVLARHSVLRHSVAADDSRQSDIGVERAGAHEAFRSGVQPRLRTATLGGASFTSARVRCSLGTRRRKTAPS